MTIEMAFSYPSGGAPMSRFNWMRTAVGWADEAGPMMRTALKAEAPVGTGPRSGRLRTSIRYERNVRAGSVTMTFTANTPYAKYVLEGTREHDIYPVAARYLHFIGKRGPVFVGPRGSGAHVHHPGTKPNPFPQRALGPMEPMLQRTFRQALETALGGTP
jgi:HK97 gp10 family phage protein